MNKILSLTGLLVLLITSVANAASLQPGEVAIRGKFIKESTKEVTFYAKKLKKEYTFKKSKRPKFTVRVNSKKAKSGEILKLQDADECQWVSIIIYFDPKKFDKDENANYAGYEVRRLGAFTKEYAAEQRKRKNANNPHL